MDGADTLEDGSRYISLLFGSNVDIAEDAKRKFTVVGCLHYRHRMATWRPDGCVSISEVQMACSTVVGVKVHFRDAVFCLQR